MLSVDKYAVWPSTYAFSQCIIQITFYLLLSMSNPREWNTEIYTQVSTAEWLYVRMNSLLYTGLLWIMVFLVWLRTHLSREKHARKKEMVLKLLWTVCTTSKALHASLVVCLVGRPTYTVKKKMNAGHLSANPTCQLWERTVLAAL